MTRVRGLDALRGLMLVLMALTHLPTAASRWSNQPLGFVSNAEGFVFLSAVLVGIVYSAPALQDLGVVGGRLWRRSLQLYRYHLMTLAFAFSVGAWLAIAGRRPGLGNLLDHYIADPQRALVQSLLLVYQPPLMDVLPLYVVFVALAPLMLWVGGRFGWRWILAASAILWLAAQVGLRSWIHGAVDDIWPNLLPQSRYMGAFNFYAWQAVWVYGVWLGYRWKTARGTSIRTPPKCVAAAAVVVVPLLVLRYLLLAEVPTGDWWRVATSKWNLGPVRVLDFACLALLVARYGRFVMRRIPTAPLEILGRSSLIVFTAHVMVCILAAGLTRHDPQAIAPVMQIALLAFMFSTMYLVALLHQHRRWLPRSSRQARAPTGAE